MSETGAEDRRSGGVPDRSGPARVAMGRMGALLTSVMDLHVRIALQEVDRERRRLISGVLLLSGGLLFLLLSLVAAELALLVWLQQGLGLGWIPASLVLASLNLVLAGIFLKVGGQLTKGPYLPQTAAGITKTTRTLLGR